MNKYNIYIIDDNETVVESLEQFFKSRGHSVRYPPFLSPLDAINEISNRYDVIFIDFQFPLNYEMNGADIASRIRKKCPLLPLILITAFGDEEEYMSRAHQEGFDALFTKDKDGEPIDETRIFKRIEEAIERVKKRVEYTFDVNDDRVVRVQKRLEYINQAVINCGERNITDARITEKIAELMASDGLADNKIPKTYNAHDDYFKLFEKGDEGTYTTNALITRQLLFADTDNKYSKAKNQFNCVNRIKKHFCIPG